MPVYLIQPKTQTSPKSFRLVRANTPSQAVRHVATDTLAVEVAKGTTIAELMSAGVKCEDARAPESGELPLEAPVTPPAAPTEIDEVRIDHVE